MELWIRSQDKRTLVNTRRIDVDDTNIIIWDEGKYASDVFMGSYKTKERALEVLDEIQKLIKPTFKINYEYDDSKPIIDGEWLKSLKAEGKIEELSCYVYEMPKE